MSGTNGPTSDRTAGAVVTGTESFTFLPGEFFIRQKWQRDFEGGPHIGTAIIGYDADTKAFFAHHYDNLGYVREYKLHQEQRSWIYEGHSERARFEFSADGMTLTETWEGTQDGHTWQTLCELKGTKSGEGS